MKILALDSSGLVASVAIVEDDVMLAEYTTNFKKTHSQTLLPMLDEVVKMLELNLEEIDAIAVAAGPGSFTGLRIGSATAKGLGLALKKPLIGIPTLEALAYNLYGTDQLICPIMDARREQVYTGIYQYVNDQMEVISDQKAVGIDELLEELMEMNQKVIFVGDGVEVYKSRIMEKMGKQCSFAPSHLCKQRAGAVGALGVQYYKAGKMEDAKDHQPVYLRLSQAERELAMKQQMGVVHE